MKRKTGFWVIIGTAIGTTTTIASHNILAGLFIGAGAGMLLMIVTNLETDKKS
ncbi:MAG: hypothetical protein JNK14_01800 [Chitinophagaceae bacterium]|nr:hypothetical protein [Chitinophagaceae bacterium]